MKKINKHFAYFVIITFIGIVFYSIYFSTNEETKIITENCSTISENWQLNDEKINLPYKIDSKADEKIILKNNLPDYIDDNYSLSFLANYSINEIYIDNELIYTYGSKQTMSFGNMVGNIRCIVNLDKEFAGKEITWIITPYYTQTIEIPKLTIDITEKIEFNILLKNLWRIIIVIVPLILCIVIFSFVIYRTKNHLNYNNNLFIYYALFMINLVGWIICSSDIPQFFTNNNQIVSFISFICIAFMATTYCGLNQCILDNFSKTFIILKNISLLNVLIQLISFVINFKDPIEFLMLTHGIILLILLVSTTLIFKTLKENKSLKSVLIGNFVFIVFIVLALNSFWQHPGNGDDAMFLTFGFFTLIGSYFCVILKKEAKLIKKAETLKIYKNLAFKDSLTGLKNRAAYDNDLDKITSDEEIKNISIIICDLNYLKTTNDTLGHEKGDLLIKEAANCIYNTFNKIATCYRLGGDEFLILATNKKKETKDYIKEFEENMKKYNENNELNLSIAYGVSDAILENENKELQIRKAFREADDKMYEMKLKQHKQI